MFYTVTNPEEDMRRKAITWAAMVINRAGWLQLVAVQKDRWIVYWLEDDGTRGESHQAGEMDWHGLCDFAHALEKECPNLGSKIAT